MKKVILFLSLIAAVASVQAQKVSTSSLGDFGCGISCSDGSTVESRSGKSSSEKQKVSKFANLFAPKEASQLDSFDAKSLEVVDTKVKKDRDIKSGITRIYASYAVLNMSVNAAPNVSDYDPNGFSVGINHARNLLRGYLYLDFGFGVNYSSEEYDYYMFSQKSKSIKLKVPVGLMGNINLSKSVAIRPYAGLGMNLNLEMEDEMRGAEKFTTGFQGGLGVALSSIYLGLDWQSIKSGCADLTQMSLAVGVTF